VLVCVGGRGGGWLQHSASGCFWCGGGGGCLWGRLSLRWLISRLSVCIFFFFGGGGGGGALLGGWDIVPPHTDNHKRKNFTTTNPAFKSILT